MRIHLVDGTYELFRSFFGAPPKKAPDGREVGATLGLLNSLLSLLSKSGATHVACAFDHVIESFRNDLFPGYKTSQGVASELLAQFPLAEAAVAALGVVVWPMVECEADDALASAATRFQSEAGVVSTKVAANDALRAGTQKGSGTMAQPVMYLMATIGSARSSVIVPPTIVRYPIQRNFAGLMARSSPGSSGCSAANRWPLEPRAAVSF